MESNQEFMVGQLALNVVIILNELPQFILLSKNYVCIYTPCKYRMCKHTSIWIATVPTDKNQLRLVCLIILLPSFRTVAGYNASRILEILNLIQTSNNSN